ncbi:MAG: diaminopimelate epimerase [Candidatus Omnitrophota bacterium]
MKHLKITKMQGSGNDFVVIESRQSLVVSSQLIMKMCDRKYGIGADGVLLLEKTNKADIRMRVFNADGSEAEMCGNGVRCAALWVSAKHKAQSAKLKIETKAGIIKAEVARGNIKIKLTDPQDLKLDLHVVVLGKDYEVDFINTGVPHAVVKVVDLARINVRDIGRAIRRNEIFGPAGTNVDFIKVMDKGHILVRTYERGVEDETLACGTGSVASAIVAVLGSGGESMDRAGESHKVSVKTKSSESLNVYFKVSKKKITDVWLEGKAQIVFTGSYPIQGADHV